MKLSTNRLILKPVAESDLEQLLQIQLDKEVMKLMNYKELTMDDQRKWLATLGKTSLAFSIFLNQEPFVHEIIGLATINNIDNFHQRASWGLKFKNGLQQKGFGYESTLMLMHYGFSELNLHKFYGDCVAENFASRKMSKKIGVTEDGLLRQHFLLNGEYKDLVFYGILKEEFYTKNQAVIDEIDLQIEID